MFLNRYNSKEVEIYFKSDLYSQVLCMGGTSSRMRELAIYLPKIVGVSANSEPVDLAAAGHRYAVYKVGPVLCVSHGVGSSTFSVVLHELLKLVKYAKCQDPKFIRIGTCGGVGVTPGTVVVTKDAYNGYLRNEHEIVSIEYLFTILFTCLPSFIH